LNTVLGNGLEVGTGWWAENGVQIAWGAGGSIIENDVSACQVNSPSWVATGIMVYDAVNGVNTLNNSVTDCDTGIAVISPSYDVVDGNVVTGCTWDGIRLGWPVDNCTVSNNIISGNWAGIGVWDASDNIIEDNIIDDNEYGICMDGDSHNNVIIRNDILNNVIDGIHIEPYYVDPSGTKVHYNNIAGNGVCGVNKTGSATVDARFNWWGDLSGPYHDDTNLMGSGDKVTDNVNYSPWLGFGAGTTPMTYHVNPTGKIQDAIDDASPGDTIIIHEGTYVENVNINKSLTLKAASRPVIDGNQAGPCITIVADGATVDGFELTNGTFGIASWGTDNSVISDNVIHNNLNVPGYAGIGIMFWSNNDDFDNNIIEGNEIYNNDRQGIYIGGTTNGYISQGNIISRNTIYNNGLNTTGMGPDASMYGIQLSFADNNTIVGNEIYDHDDWFPYPDFDFAQGIYLFDSNNNHVKCNYLHDNNYGVGLYHYYRAVGNNYINYNNIAGNTGYGVRTFDGSLNVDARYNWWGDASGPYHPTTNPTGTGDRVSDNVDFDPWLDGPIPGDVAIIDIAPSRNMTCEGQILDIFVEVKNEGSLTATFTVTLYYDSVAIETKTATNLAPGASATLTFSWDTTGVTPCTSYTISAEASTLSCEVDTADNVFVDDKVKINIFGDITGDGLVDIDDIMVAAFAYGGYPGNPRWNPEVDMNNDKIIDIDDVVQIAINYGKTHQ